MVSLYFTRNLLHGVGIDVWKRESARDVLAHAAQLFLVKVSTGA